MFAQKLSAILCYIAVATASLFSSLPCTGRQTEVPLIADDQQGEAANQASSHTAKEIARPVEKTTDGRPPTNQSLSKSTEKKVYQNSLAMKFVKLPAGDFLMGSHESPDQVAKAFLKERPERFQNEHPLRRIEIERPFYIGTTEVTVAQFRQFISDTEYKTRAEVGTIGESATPVEILEKSTWRNPLSANFVPDAQHPVAMITYDDAVAFCQWLSLREGRTYRLPTDQEWEYAARAGTQTRYWNGNRPDKLAEIANVPDASRARDERYEFEPEDVGFNHTDRDDGFLGFAPVGSYHANPWGLYDVHGNVWEWCSVVNPDSLKISDTKDIAVIRGGCFY